MLVVLLVLCGEAVAQVRIPHVVNSIRGSQDDIQISTRLPLLPTCSRLWTCRSTSALHVIVRLGASLIYLPFGPQYNFMVSIIKRPPVLELFFRGTYIRNYRVLHLSKKNAVIQRKEINQVRY